MVFARWSKSLTSTWIFGGAVQLFSCFSFSFSGAFLGNGDLSVGGTFLSSGVDSFFLWRFFFLVRGVFLGEGDLFFYFFWGGGSPLFGENKAFMAEPSDRPAINDGTPKLKRVNEKN